VRAIVW